MPMFHAYVEVRGRLHVLTPTQKDAFDPTFGLPSLGELAIGGIEKIRSAVVKHMRSRAERRAWREVKDALAAFCAARACSPHVKAYIRAQEAEDEQDASSPKAWYDCRDRLRAARRTEHRTLVSGLVWRCVPGMGDSRTGMAIYLRYGLADCSASRF
jgi:hypothetical protein